MEIIKIISNQVFLAVGFILLTTWSVQTHFLTQLLSHVRIKMKLSFKSVEMYLMRN